MIKQLKTLTLCGTLCFAPVAVSDNLVEVLIAANEDRNGVYFRQFDSLIAAVVKAELVDALSADTEDGLTVFGPDDDAFEKLGLFPAVIEVIPAEILQAILLYHVVPTEVVAADVVSKPVQVLDMADGGKTLVRSIPRGNFINLAEITDVDIFADNGVFHVIDRVLIPTRSAD